MNERKKTSDLEQVRLMDIEALCKYLSMGKKSSREFARSIHAERRFGRCTRYDKVVIDGALNMLTQQEKEKDLKVC